MTEMTLEMVEEISHQMAKKLMEWDEPIPEFSTRYPGRLESCLKTPWQTFDKKFLYPSLEDKASVLFYLLIKNHPFQNGNKRIAVTTMLIFLFTNRHWLQMPADELYQLAVWVAGSPAKAKEGTLIAIKDILRKHLQPL